MQKELWPPSAGKALDMPALRLFFAALLHDGPKTNAEVEEAFADRGAYYGAVYALSTAGFIVSVRGKHGQPARWHLIQL